MRKHGAKVNKFSNDSIRIAFIAERTFCLTAADCSKGGKYIFQKYFPFKGTIHIIRKFMCAAP